MSRFHPGLVLLGGSYPEVDNFAALPPAAGEAGDIYVVLNSTGIYLINRKEAGLYYSDGATWNRLGDIVSFFQDDNFEIYNAADNTKQFIFDLSLLSPSTAVPWSIPNNSIGFLKNNGAGVLSWDGTIQNPVLFQNISSSLAVTASTTANDPVWSPLISASVALSTVSDLMVSFTTSFFSDSKVTGKFRVSLNGAPIAGTSTEVGKDGQRSAAFTHIFENISAITHSVLIEWTKNPLDKPSGVLSIDPGASPYNDHAVLFIQEIAL